RLALGELVQRFPVEFQGRHLRRFAERFVGTADGHRSVSFSQPGFPAVNGGRFLGPLLGAAAPCPMLIWQRPGGQVVTCVTPGVISSAARDPDHGSEWRRSPIAGPARWEAGDAGTADG